jgi:hypothetical protein
MQALIEEYRGWEIFFDTEKENFYTTAEKFDYQTTKKSYASAKKFIDDFIKDNMNFKPVMIQTKHGDPRKLIGIRKDGRFIYEGWQGKPVQLESYHENDYFLVDEVNDPIFKKIKELEAQQEQLRLEVIEQLKHLKMVPIKTLKELYLPGHDLHTEK